MLEFRGDRAGAQQIREMVAGPRLPKALAYLNDWLDELHGRSGVNMNGLNPLTWECLDAWQRMTCHVVYPHEARALIMLDAILCFPPKEGES